MKERKRILTIFGGIGMVLTGIFLLVISGEVLISSISGVDPWIAIVTFGLSIIFMIIIFIFALGLAITLITVGAFEIRLGIYKNLEYSERTGLLIGFSIFEGILIVLFVIAAILFQSSEMLLFSSLAVAIGIGISFLIKIIDHIIFKVYVKKGKIVLVQNSATASSAQLNINLENLDKIDLTNNKTTTKKSIEKNKTTGTVKKESEAKASNINLDALDKIDLSENKKSVKSAPKKADKK